MPTTITNELIFPIGDRGNYLPSVQVELLPPMRYSEDSWFLIQDEGWKYLSEPRYNHDKNDEQVVNKMYIDFHRIPGDIALKVIARAFGIDIESREVAEYLYKITCSTRICG